MNEPRLLVATEVAELTRSSLRHVREMTARGQLPVLRFGGKVLYPLDALQRYIAENTAAPERVDGDLTKAVARSTSKRRARGKPAQSSGKPPTPQPTPVSASGRARPIRLDGVS